MLDLPYNPRATFLWWYVVPEAHQKAVLVGPALVTVASTSVSPPSAV